MTSSLCSPQRSVLALVVALTLASSPALALSVQVSPGDDIATITSSLAAGDEIVFGDGVYAISDNLSWTGEGTADAPIVLRAADGASPVIELVQTKDGGWDSIIAYVSEARFLQIQGLAFRGGDGWESDGASFTGLYISESSDLDVVDVEVSQTGSTGVRLAGNNTRVHLLRPHVHDTRDGDAITMGCSDASCFVTDSTVEGAWIHGVRGSRYGIYLAHGSQGVTVSDTVIYDVEYRGIFLGSAESGDPNIVQGSALWQVGDWAMTVYGASRIRNNLVFLAGGGIYAGDPERGSYEDVVISYNTVVDTVGDAVGLDDWTAASGMVLSSNALCNPVGLGVDVARETDEDGLVLPLVDALITNNVICGYVTGLSADEGQLLAGDGYGDFVDVSGWSLYPTRDSILRDAGDPSGGAWVPEVDFNGVARSGDAPDVGAYEWTQDDNPGWVIQDGYKDTAVDNSVPPQVIGGCCGKKKGQDGGDTGAAFLLPLSLLVGLRRFRPQRASDRRASLSFAVARGDTVTGWCELRDLVDHGQSRG